MKKILFFCVPIMSILSLAAAAGAYFIGDIFNLIKLDRTVNPTLVNESDIQILLLLSIVGLVAIMRRRPNKK